MLGEKNADKVWDFQALEEAGITTLGTDWPVWPTIDPLVNAWTATQGVQKSFQSAYTWDSYTNHVQTCLNEPIGCLEVGCIADRTWMSSDPYQHPQKMGDIEIISGSQTEHTPPLGSIRSLCPPKIKNTGQKYIEC